MSDTNTNPAVPPTFEPDRFYRVAVDRVVAAGPLRVTPRDGATLIGTEAEKIRDAIVSAEIVE